MRIVEAHVFSSWVSERRGGSCVGGVGMICYGCSNETLEDVCLWSPWGSLGGTPGPSRGGRGQQRDSTAAKDKVAVQLPAVLLLWVVSVQHRGQVPVLQCRLPPTP